MLEVHLIRHGATDWNDEGRLQGQTDIPLNDRGRGQASRLAERLSRTGLSAIYSSDLARAAETAEAIAAAASLDVRADPRLRERMLGDWEGLTAEEIVGRGDAEKLRLYRQDSVQFPSPGSEPLEAMWDRMRRTLDDARAEHSSGSIAIVGHGSSLRVLICEALGAGGDVFRRFVLDNGSVSILEFGGPLSRVRLVNDTSHLAGA